MTPESKSVVLFGNDVFDILNEIDGVFETLWLIDEHLDSQELENMKYLLLRKVEETHKRAMDHIRQTIFEAKGEAA